MQTYEDTAVKVVYGVNELSLDLGGKSIRGIWKMLEQVLNLPRETTVRVNGQVVADDHIVRPGDEIDFLVTVKDRLEAGQFHGERGLA